jgi:RimJ/RimL family protein N-acetyltransferase
VQLTTDRLILREYVVDDWHRIWEYRADERYMRYYPEEESTEQRAREFLEMVMGWAAEEPRRKYQLAITHAEDGVLIGSCGVRITPMGDREAEFGCELDSQEWKKGYAREASRAVIDFGFRELALHRVWARTIAENLAAIRLAEQIGMRLEGLRREDHFFQDRWWDHVIYSLLEQEWRAEGQA